jgi:hypothetical protein
MTAKRFVARTPRIVLVLFIGGCNAFSNVSPGGTAGAVATPATVTAPVKQRPLNVTPSSLTFHDGRTQTVVVLVPVESVVKAKSANAGIATIDPPQAGQGYHLFTVTPVAVGSTRIVFADADPVRSATVAVTVQSVSAPSPTPSPDGAFSFVPSGPFAVKNNAKATATVSEADYSGTFTLAGCSGPNCVKTGAGYTCYNSTDESNDNELRVTLTVNNVLHVSDTAFGTKYWPADDCTFTVRDGLGNTGNYEIVSAGFFPPR